MMRSRMNFVLACVMLHYAAAADYRAHELIMSVLSQFLSKNTYQPEPTTTPSSILPAILNPMHWIPNFKDIPWNPDAELTTPEIALRHGYPAESYPLITDDGYILNIHRIPCGRNGCDGRVRQPVFLQHGILASSADWVLSGPDKALGFLLADLGYDVWMGNSRGNTYSRHHVSLSNNDKKYWDFSFHEMAIHDIPAEIDFIYSHRKKIYGEFALGNDLIYIGHSMGTTMNFIMLSEKPDYNDKIKLFIALAPVAFMSHIKSPIRFLAPFSKDIEFPLDFLNQKLKLPHQWSKQFEGISNELWKKFSLNFLTIMKFFGQNEFLPQNKIIKWLSKYGCELNEAERYICENTVFLICGFDKEQYNATLMPVIFAHTPAGTSTKTVVHYAQEIHERGNFQNFDYGSEENMRRYGSNEPPAYNLRNITTPIALFYADNDWLAGYQDVKMLYSALSVNSAKVMYKIPFSSFNHLDYLWGVDAPELVYAKIFEIIQSHG